jgi:hypothetical protein
MGRIEYSLTVNHICCNIVLVKTTIDIPTHIYTKAKITAFERGIRLRELVISALSHEIYGKDYPAEEGTAYWDAPVILPEYQRLIDSGMLDSSLDSTESISADRERA